MPSAPDLTALPGLDPYQSLALRQLVTPGMKGRGVRALNKDLEPTIPSGLARLVILLDLRTMGLIKITRTRFVITAVGQQLLRENGVIR